MSHILTQTSPCETPRNNTRENHADFQYVYFSTAIGHLGIRRDNPVFWLEQNRLQGPLLQVYVEFLLLTVCGETKCGAVNI
jgi:hypothetical protein